MNTTGLVLRASPVYLLIVGGGFAYFVFEGTLRWAVFAGLVVLAALEYAYLSKYVLPELDS